MLTQDSLDPNGGFALLLLGAPKTGKSTCAMAFPNPYFLDCEGNLQAAARRYPGKKFWYDRVDIDEKGNVIPERERWDRAMSLLNEAAHKPEIETIVVDTISRLSDWLCTKLVTDPAQATKPLVIGGTICMTQSHWFPFGTMLKRFIGVLRSIPNKLIIVNCHEKTDKDEVLGTLMYKPAIGGETANTIAGFFTDVWRCESMIGQPTAQNKSGISYIVRTTPTPRMQLSNAFGLPSEFSFTWEEFSKRLKEKKV